MHGWSVTRRLFLAFVVGIVALAVFVGTASYVHARDRAYAAAGDRMLAVATAIAASPLVVTAASSPDPTTSLQAYTLQVSEDAALDFVTVMSPSGTTWTHPDETEIGRPYAGTTTGVLAGRPVTEVAPGTSAPSVRTVVPILDHDDTLVGLVAAGVHTSSLQIALDARLPATMALTVAVLLVATPAAWLLGRYLRRVTLGWGSEELARRFAYTDVFLTSGREGLVLVDRAGTIVLYNDRAARLLGLPPRQPVRGAGSPTLTIDDADLPASVAALMRSGRTVRDELHDTGSHALLVSQEPAIPTPSRRRSRTVPLGTVLTLLDQGDRTARRGPADHQADHQADHKADHADRPADHPAPIFD